MQIYPELGWDQTYFFCDNFHNVVPLDEVITVLRLLFHMRVPVFCDEFQDLPYGRALGKRVKVRLKPAHSECSQSGEGFAA